MPANTRTKSGCITCKIRKVKCDGAKPHCQRCVSTGWQCDGYSTLPYSRAELLATAGHLSQASVSTKHALIDDHTFGNVWEKRCFEFFKHRTVASTNALINARFWDRVVLQSTHVERAIKHGVLALSSYDQLSTMTGESWMQQRSHADHQYHLCLRYAQELLSRADEHDIDRVLITCIICTHYELARGHFRASKQHVSNGRAIMQQYADKFRQTHRRSDLAEIQQALARLDVSLCSFNDKSAPCDYTMENFGGSAPFVAPWAFADLFEARNCLFDLSRWLLLTLHQMYFAYTRGDIEGFREYKAKKQLCKTRLDEWDRHFQAIATNSPSSEEPIILMLRAWYIGQLLLVDPDPAGPEQRFDAHLSHFETLVSIGEQVVAHLSQSSHHTLSYDLGYGNNMFFAAQHCRDPNLRRRAVKVLRAIPSRQEGAFLSGPAANIVERLIELEEAGLSISAAEDVPEERRVWYVELELDFDKSLMEVEFHFSQNGTSARDFVVERFHWGQEGMGGVSK